MKRTLTWHPVGLVVLTLLLGMTVAQGQPAAAESPAFLVVRLPADASLMVEDYQTKATGDVRRFQSPPLAPGRQFTYTLKATWKEDGKEKTVTRDVKVRAGQEVTVDLTQPGRQLARRDAPVRLRHATPHHYEPCRGRQSDRADGAVRTDQRQLVAAAHPPATWWPATTTSSTPAAATPAAA